MEAAEMKESEKVDPTVDNEESSSKKKWTSTATISVLFIFLLFLGSFFIFRIQDTSITEEFHETELKRRHTNSTLRFALNCTNESLAKTCKVNYTQALEPHESSDTVCPDYFRWIHEDLRPWKDTGISRDTLEKARSSSNFRLVIVNGRAYLEKLVPAYQTRDLFTIWGIVQLLRLYPGKVPDLEFMFQCDDIPYIEKKDYEGPNTTSLPPPPLFQYCGRDSAFAIVFPDWAFWGWPEVNIEVWENMLEGIINGSKRMEWKKRSPYAFWKGNPDVSPNRKDLMKCKLSYLHDWGARLYSQDWIHERKHGFKSSKIEDQCKYRYKIYVEGRGWSVSCKYIIGCDSMTLFIKPTYYDFFMRSLVPLQHYWPITIQNKCKSIKFAVKWGNKHPEQVQAIGNRGQTFIKEDLKMENVYAYMFHLLKEYAKLQRFKPRIPLGAEELCSESMACRFDGEIRNLMEDSMVISPSDKGPCVMPPPYDPSALQSFLEMKENMTTQVLNLEKGYWRSKNKKQYLLSSLN
ncbi:uncharacterized protein [Euphorbia lathyris]|uniref:uncharacterized protein n=1 Tax=Euphorbia lathyris TaxID=212925 RepID=UPI0033134BF6